MVTGPSTTWCQVSDMERACAFYRDVLGLQPGIQSPYWSEFQAGGLKIGLHPAKAGSEPPLGVEGKGWYLGLATDDLKALKSQATRYVVGDFHQTPGGVVLTLADPDGNPIQVIQAGSKLADLER